MRWYVRPAGAPKGPIKTRKIEFNAQTYDFMRVFGFDGHTAVVGIAMACSISDHLMSCNALDLPFLRIVVGSKDGEVRTCHAQKAYIVPINLR